MSLPPAHIAHADVVARTYPISLDEQKRFLGLFNRHESKKLLSPEYLTYFKLGPYPYTFQDILNLPILIRAFKNAHISLPPVSKDVFLHIVGFTLPPTVYLNSHKSFKAFSQHFSSRNSKKTNPLNLRGRPVVIRGNHFLMPDITALGDHLWEGPNPLFRELVIFHNRSSGFRPRKLPPGRVLTIKPHKLTLRAALWHGDRLFPNINIFTYYTGPFLEVEVENLRLSSAHFPSLGTIVDERLILKNAAGFLPPSSIQAFCTQLGKKPFHLESYNSPIVTPALLMEMTRNNQLASLVISESPTFAFSQFMLLMEETADLEDDGIQRYGHFSAAFTPKAARFVFVGKGTDRAFLYKGPINLSPFSTTHKNLLQKASSVPSLSLKIKEDSAQAWLEMMGNLKGLRSIVIDARKMKRSKSYHEFLRALPWETVPCVETNLGFAKTLSMLSKTLKEQRTPVRLTFREVHPPNSPSQKNERFTGQDPVVSWSR